MKFIKNLFSIGWLYDYGFYIETWFFYFDLQVWNCRDSMDHLFWFHNYGKDKDTVKDESDCKHWVQFSIFYLMFSLQWE